MAFSALLLGSMSGARGQVGARRFVASATRAARMGFSWAERPIRAGGMRKCAPITALVSNLSLRIKPKSRLFLSMEAPGAKFLWVPMRGSRLSKRRLRNMGFFILPHMEPGEWQGQTGTATNHRRDVAPGGIEAVEKPRILAPILLGRIRGDGEELGRESRDQRSVRS
jgi:hypothetical protein